MYIYNCISIYIHKYTYNAHAYRNIMYIVWIVQGVDNPGHTHPAPKYSKREYWAIELFFSVNVHKYNSARKCVRRRKIGRGI